MKVYTIEDVKGTPGMVVPTMDLTIRKLWDAKTGTTKQGKPWMLRSGIATDGAQEIKIAFWDREDGPQIGDRFMVHSVMTKKGLAGITVKEEEYNGNTTVSLSISKSARIEPFGVKPASEAQKLTEAIQNLKQDKVAPEVNPERNSATPEERIDQYASLYEICLIRAQQIESAKGFSDQSIKDIASCLFIQAVKEGLANQIAVVEAF